jgi:hypothetical protein
MNLKSVRPGLWTATVFVILNLCSSTAGSLVELAASNHVSTIFVLTCKIV